jgi:hypothetical protein
MDQHNLLQENTSAQTNQGKKLKLEVKKGDPVFLDTADPRHNPGNYRLSWFAILYISFRPKPGRE